MLAAQRAATPERIEQAKRDADESADTMFAAVLGKPLTAANLPATTRLFARLEETGDAVLGPAKKAFKRVRPYISDPEIKALVRPSITGSYPSGHTTHINASAIVMGDIVPEKRDAIWERAHDYSQSRVIGGMHYPNDLDGGNRAGTAIAVALQGRPEFKADFEAARRELRQYLEWRASSLHLPRHDPRPQRPAVHLRRAVVDAERADVAEDALDHRVARDAQAAQDLHRAVGDAGDRLGADHLGHRAFVRRPLAAVEHPGGVPDRQPRDVDVHLVVGQHERHALVLAELLAERLALARIVGRDVLRPVRPRPASACSA